MKLRKNIITAFLLTIAVILSQAIPSIYSIPDFNTIILIIIILLNNNYKNTLIYGIFFGMLSAFITKAPNGQIPNIIDKIITSNVVYLLMIILKNIDKNKSIKIILFFSLFVNNIVFFTLYFLINGIFINNNIFITESILLLLIACIINTMIGNIIFKSMKRCINSNNN